MTTRPCRSDYHTCQCLQEEELLSIGFPPTWLCSGCFEFDSAMRAWTYQQDDEWKVAK